MKLEILSGAFGIYKVAAVSKEWLKNRFLFAAKTDTEVSIVTEITERPNSYIACQEGYSAIRISGQLDFSLVGILSQLTGILAEHAISVFAVSTYDTDYVLFEMKNLDRVCQILREKGYEFTE